MPVGLVLSGGGSRGDFQVGAVQYLYNVRNVRPNILCGTSVGAINSAKLCEGEDPSDSTRGLRGLIGFWEELRLNRDMWATEGWYANIEQDAQKALNAAVAAGVTFIIPGLWPVSLMILLFGGASDISRFVTDLQQASTAKSLYNIAPVRAKLMNPSKFRPDRVASSGIVLRLTVVSLESGTLRYVTQNGSMLERNGTPVHGSTTYAAECQELADDLDLLESLREQASERLGNPPRGTTQGDIALEIMRLSQEIHQARTALATCEAQHPPQSVPLVVGLVDGIMASAAIPVAFPPVKLGNENYVDGGARDIVPIEAAVQAGATQVYVVSASASAMPRPRSMLDGHLIANFNNTNLLDITNRVADEIMTSEIVEFKMDPPNGWGSAQVIVIEPDFDIHDIMTIDAGLIRMRMSHGYMRADDVMQAHDQDPAHYRTLAETLSANRSTTTIIELRRAIWEREYAANGWRFSLDNFGRPKPMVAPGDQIPSDNDALADVRAMKRQLKTLVDQRIAAGGQCPPGVENWWLQWERHDWEPVRPLWDAANPFAPLRHLQVAVDQQAIPLGIPVQVLVTATDGSTPINNAGVLVNGQQVGVTGTRFTHTFSRQFVQVFDPETRSYYPEEVDPTLTVRGDRQVYYEEHVACEFFDAILNAQIMSQSVPTTLTPGQTASVAITVKNTGTVTWTSAAGYKLGSQSPQDNTTWGTNRVNLPGPVAPGAQVSLTFNVTAPATAGNYVFQWQMVMEGVQWFGALTSAVTIAVAAPLDRRAQFISQTVPASMVAGQSVPVTIVLQNTGNVTWTADTGYKLGSQSPRDNTNWGTNRGSLPAPVAPGAQVALSFSVTAPSTPGGYTFQWQMLQDGFGSFGQLTTAQTVNVVAPVYDAQFVSQSVPELGFVGRSISAQISMKNTGNATWTASAGFNLGSQSPQDNTRWKKNRIPVPSSVAPGQTVTFTFTGCTAPTTPGTYVFQWRMLREGVQWFGPLTPAIEVSVETLQ